MVTVQMTLDEQLVKKVDDMVQKLRTSRSAFARQALKDAIKKHEILELERQHREGYLKKPLTKDELMFIENVERAWGDDY